MFGFVKRHPPARMITEARVSKALRPTSRDDCAASEFAGTMSGLAVVPGDVPNACDGGTVAEGAVGALLVVVVDPVWQ